MTDFAPLTLETPAEHPFAPFVRILGKGKRGARNLTREEAREAMGMLLDEKVEDTQLGAFLMLLRHKEESPEELAGFTEAVRERLHAPALEVDIDWRPMPAKSATCRGSCWPPSAWRRTVYASSCMAAAPTRPAGCTPSNCWKVYRSRCAAIGSRSRQPSSTATWHSSRWADGPRNCNA